MISLSYRAVFVHIPKTAGSSVYTTLGLRDIAAPHRNIVQLGEILGRTPEGRAFFDEAFKFAFVRNPWDRVVSLFHRKERGRVGAPETFPEFCAWIEHASDTCVHPTTHRNQVDWITDESGAIAVDFVGRFESLHRDFRHVCERLATPYLSLAHEKDNRAGRRPYTEYYTPELRDMIGEKFAVDIARFGYAFGA